MKYLVYTFILTLSFIYPQCDNLSEDFCNNDQNCEWVENIDYESCSNLAWQVCENYFGCYVDSEPGWYDSSGPYCTGGTYQIDNSYCEEAEILECFEMNELECSDDDGCDWVVDIETGYCGSHNTSASCPNYPVCSWSCDGCWYLGECCGSYICTGGSYQINNSYCEEVEILECSEMNQLQCIQDDGCDWQQNGMESENCNSLNTYGQCNAIDDCSWSSYQQQCTGGAPSDCTQDGCSYSWLEYTCTGSYTVSYCGGGTYEVPTYSCEESSFMPGDATGDGYLDVMDVVMIVDFILNDEYDMYADINQDGILNVMDVVELVSTILGN